MTQVEKFLVKLIKEINKIKTWEEFELFQIALTLSRFSTKNKIFKLKRVK